MGTLSTRFWCLCQKLSLSPLYFNKTLLHKSSECSNLVLWPQIEFFYSGGQETNRLCMIQQLLLSGEEGDNRGWEGWMASPTQWTRVWVDSRRWWWIGRPGFLQSMGSQRVGHGWVTELKNREKRNHSKTGKRGWRQYSQDPCPQVCDPRMGQ